MSTPGDDKRLIVMLLFAVWVMAFVYSFVAFTGASAEGAGPFGWSPKAMAYLGWQAIAACLAVSLFGLGYSWPRESGVRRMTRLPFILALLQIVAVLGLRLWTYA